MVNQGRSIELFFHDGDPEGMVTATIPFQWTGHVLVAGRTQLAELLTEPETKNPGVYMLLGDNEGDQSLYVGETDDISKRIRQHSSTEGKDWWETAILVTAQGEPLNKAHARFLEFRLYDLAKSAGRVKIENGNAPTESPLSRAAAAHMEDFVEKLQLVLPALRFDFLIKRSKSEEADQPIGLAVETELFSFEVPRHRVKATARLNPSTGDFIVQRGSVGRENWIGTNTQNSTYARLREQLISQEILVQREDDLYVFARDYIFKSTSPPAAVLAGRAATGPGSWVHVETGETYGEWEQRRLSLN